MKDKTLNLANPNVGCFHHLNFFCYRLAGEKSAEPTPEVNSHASQVLCNLVNSADKESKPGIVDAAMSAVPSLSHEEAEVLTTVLTEMSVTVTPEIVKETVEIIAGSNSGTNFETVFKGVASLAFFPTELRRLF